MSSGAPAASAPRAQGPACADRFGEGACGGFDRLVSDLTNATAEQVLRAAEAGVRDGRLLEVRKLELLLAWADLHSGDPQDEPGAVPIRYGGPRLVTLGGDDTPLARHHHRAKTHLGYPLFQLGPDRWVWGTPHGLYRLVTGTGTTALSQTEYHLLTEQAVVLADGYAAGEALSARAPEAPLWSPRPRS